MISAQNFDFRELNRRIKTAKETVYYIDDCFGQRFIGSGMPANT